MWTQWQPWGVCDKECGEGLQNYTRICLDDNNVYCPGNNTETKKCKNGDCPGKQNCKIQCKFDFKIRNALLFVKILEVHFS